MFSKELEQSISSLFDQAQKTDIEYISNKYQNDKDNVNLNQSGFNLSLIHI